MQPVQTFKFCQFLLDCEAENYSDNKGYKIELKQYRRSLDELIRREESINTFIEQLINSFSEDNMSAKQNTQDGEVVMMVKELWDKHFGKSVTKDAKPAPQPNPLFQPGYLGGLPPILGGTTNGKNKEQGQKGLKVLDELFAANRRENRKR